jgi:phosphoribosylglycinamide formyltransferase 2
MKKILLLGSGELGKELIISLQRLGAYTIACDSYDNAPAMQVAHEYEVFNMLDGDALDAVVTKHRPDLIVPEIEAIRTERFYEYEKQGYTVVPSAKAANYTMNRKAIRDLAAIDLGLKTATYAYADSWEKLKDAVQHIGLPCVVKPLMSSSGKGQSVIRKFEDAEKSWNYAQEGQRGDAAEVIVEAFVPFESEITLLTVSQENGPTLFCPPIGHRQEGGDYRESWQPAAVNDELLEVAKEMASKVTERLKGNGIWGVEFFLTKDEVYFSELSPRPHDTGMVTLAGTQTYSEFELHARAILQLPIPELALLKTGASVAILASEHSNNPKIIGVESALAMQGIDVRIFGKPSSRPNRRMAVVLSSDKEKSSEEVVRMGIEAASKIEVLP